MRVLKVAPVDTIKVSWGEGGSRRSWRQLIRNACYVLYVEVLCYLYLPHAHSTGQSASC